MSLGGWVETGGRLAGTAILESSVAPRDQLVPDLRFALFRVTTVIAAGQFKCLIQLVEVDHVVVEHVALDRFAMVIRGDEIRQLGRGHGVSS